MVFFLLATSSSAYAPLVIIRAWNRPHTLLTKLHSLSVTLSKISRFALSNILTTTCQPSTIAMLLECYSPFFIYIYIYIYIYTYVPVQLPLPQEFRQSKRITISRLGSLQHKTRYNSSKINQKGSPFSLPSQMAPASFNPISNTVCVMDASGNLGLSLVQRLLQRGYMVHAAVQNHNCELQLNGLSCENKKLKIFYADPFDYKSIIDALRGCSGLFYTFEPPEDQPTYDESMTEVEVRAAHNVLEACAHTETIDKVVFTSSATAVIWRDDRKSEIADFDERHWSDINFCRKFKLWHALSKTLAEKTTWALAMDRGVNMVSVNAGLLVSPDLSIKNPYLTGAAELYEDGVFVTVDLNFLVDAHICIYEDVSSYGRYLCFNHVVNRHEDAIELASMLTPAAPSLPQSCDQDVKIIQQRISNKKLNELMVGFESGPQLVD